jgi:hypothetical protein
VDLHHAQAPRGVAGQQPAHRRRFAGTALAEQERMIRGQSCQELLRIHDQPLARRANAQEVVEVEERGLRDGHEPSRFSPGLPAKGQRVLEGLRIQACGHVLGEPALGQLQHARGGSHQGFGPVQQFAQAPHGTRL